MIKWQETDILSPTHFHYPFIFFSAIDLAVWTVISSFHHVTRWKLQKIIRSGEAQKRNPYQYKVKKGGYNEKNNS